MMSRRLLPLAGPIPGGLVLGIVAVLAGPRAAGAQGTAPMQGVHEPAPVPTPPGGPPAPGQESASMQGGKPRIDPGGGAAHTEPGTNAALPLPPRGQADPPATQPPPAPR